MCPHGSKHATLLFAHGGGFCRQTWDPIIRRLRASSLLQSVDPSQFVTFDFPFHGTKRDKSVTPVVNRETMRVEHPCRYWVEWATEEVYQQVQALPSRASGDFLTRAPLIGIGHSMGAVALWNTEVKHPGTFDGLILFEPIYAMHRLSSPKTTDFLVSITLDREYKWPTLDAATRYFESFRNFAAWDRESLKSYIDGAVVQDDDKTSFSLACHPEIEASIYCADTLDLADVELTRPQCRTILLNGERTKMYKREFFVDLADSLPDIYKVEPSMANTSHLMVLENPEDSAARILKGLTEFIAFQGDDDATTNLSASRL
uniref:AB hydrolase-1 domain-containing protein n=1 Tax=Globisporangium ultimum (strain ATCC 200006 / CBS 805.95 / DAOM BR144) TaxID=431595 RepID=K3X074_GLOUD